MEDDQRMPCPSCGAEISDRAASCALCGRALAVEAATAGSRRFVPSFSRVHVPEPGSNLCRRCDSRLEAGATFCSECGSAVTTGEYTSPPLPPSEPELLDDVAPVESFAPEPAFDGLEPEEDVVVVPSAPPVAASYLEDDDPDLTGPIVVEPAAARVDDAWSWVPTAAAVFAIVALLTALLVHVVAPSSLPGYSAAELSLKIQMRAVEWLLAGAVIALVGVLAKR